MAFASLMICRFCVGTAPFQSWASPTLKEAKLTKLKFQRFYLRKPQVWAKQLDQLNQLYHCERSKVEISNISSFIWGNLKFGQNNWTNWTNWTTLKEAKLTKLKFQRFYLSEETSSLGKSWNNWTNWTNWTGPLWKKQCPNLKDFICLRKPGQRMVCRWDHEQLLESWKMHGLDVTGRK